MSFPPLYGQAKTGKIKVWTIAVTNENDGVWTTIENGQVDGKMNVNRKQTIKGKNIGKVNETTPFQQAVMEAQKRWDDKVEKEGYTKEQGGAAAKAETTILPMLANKWDPNKSKKNDIVFPCFVQPKLDGERCVAFYRDGKVVLLSRKGKEKMNFDHLRQELVKIFTKYPNLCLDGELYTTAIPFEEITGICRKEKLGPADLAKQQLVEYHIYDCFEVGQNISFKERNKILQTIFSKNKFAKLIYVLTEDCGSADEVFEKHGRYTQEGFEGIMLRNKNGLYKLKNRSNDLMKYKHFVDEEFVICGYHEGTGEDQGTIIWECEYGKEGKSFSCRPKGTREFRRNLFNECEDDFSQYSGKELTVRYQELTKDGCPRFPVGIAVRDYE